ncbi:Disks large-associated protein 5 [Habropoda laboriosa]|uniref:Disks large-associated protein 5 n=1 Tax=Habropoda laboriosa TaxID=597456 RepID=A0A0L7QPG6_9HYME|nr:Disks large-associated protein 5 [Habropoda laboriosa]
MTRFLKWKVEREKCRKIEQYKRKPPFVIGVVHHKFYSPIVIRGKAHNQAAPMHLVSPKKRVTKATEKRLMNEALTQKVTKGSLKNPNVINKQKKCQKEDEQSVALIDRKFRASGRLLHVPLFGRVVIQNTPVKTNKLKFSSSRKSRVNRKSNIAIFNVKPVNIKENDTSLNDKKSHTDDSEETFNFSNNNSNNNDNKIKSVLSSSKNIISASLKSDSPEKLVFFSPYIVSSCGKSNARKEQLKCGFSLDHSSSDVTPTKHTVMKNLNISVEEGDHTAQYFQFFLNKEITRLNELCKTWAEIKIKSETTEDGQYEINQAIGQTNLLLNKKFERCRELVADCETGKGKMLVTCKDLQGLWDMLYMDIMNCDSRFEKLQKLRSRGWKEELPVDKPITKNRSIVRKNVLSTKSSFIRVFLAEKKEKMAQEMRNNDDTKEVEVRDNRILSNKYETNESSNIKYKIRESMCSTPNEKDYAPIGHDKRLSLLKKVHLSETSKKVKSLLTIIKVSQMYKTSKVHLDDTISCVNSDQTPEKSILKPTKSITILESRIKLINKVNFNDRVVLNEVPMDEEMQTKMDLAVILSKTDSFNLDSPDEITINAERKLAFDDNSSEESEIDIRYFKSKNSTIKNISPTIQVPPTTQLLRPELDKNLGIPLPRRSLRRQNALVERNEILYKTSPLEEITDDTNLNTLKKKLQKHVSINDKQEISEHDESIEVLKNITVTALCTPIVKRKSLKKVFTSIQESEFKENKTPLERRKKNSLKVSSNDKEKMDLHTWIDNMSLEESNTKRRSIKNVKFFGMDSC